MIMKESHSIAIKSLQQEQSLRDQGGTAGVIDVLNPKISGFDLIPILIDPADVGTPDLMAL